MAEVKKKKNIRGLLLIEVVQFADVRDQQGVIGVGVMTDELECNTNCTLKCVAMSKESFAKIRQI